MCVKIKRIYKPVSEDDGVRVLVDRLWPRGISKESAKLNYWMKEIGPSNELRKWFGHDPEKFTEFKEKYLEELQSGEQQKALAELKKIVKRSDKQITLLFSAKEEKYNHIQILKEILGDLV